MKRTLGVLMALPIALAACGDDDEPTVVKSFTADYDLGLAVIAEGTETTTTLFFTQIGDDVVQVDGLNATANTQPTEGAVVCRIDDENTRTEIIETVSGTAKTRIAGKQRAWLLNDAFFGNAAGSGGAADNHVNVWDDPSAGHIFLTEPKLNVYLQTQAEADCNCDLQQYIEANAVDLYIFEDDFDTNVVVETFVSQAAAGETTDVTTRAKTYTGGGNNRGIGTFARFTLHDYVWETGALAGLYNGPTPYGANMVVPENVAVGDTWLNNNGNLMAAVAIEPVEIGDRTVNALHVVERGATAVNAGEDGVAEWCVDYYTSREEEISNVTDQTSLASVLTDLCAGATKGNGTGWINLRHMWYYRGLPVKMEEERFDVTITAFGYSTPDTDGTLGSGVGNCHTQQNVNLIDEDEADNWTPYATYTVDRTVESWQAVELLDNYTIVSEYNESLEN